MIKRLAALALASVAAACATGGQQTYVPPGGMEFVVPHQQWRNADGSCVAGEICWPDLTTQQRRDLLTLVETDTRVYREETSGSLTLLPSQITTSRGTYHVFQYVTQYMNQPCDRSNPDAGFQRVGVGVLVHATLQSSQSGISLSDFIPIAISANRRKVQGRLTINGWGMSTPNNTLTGYLNYGGLVENQEALSKAIESMAVARAVMTDDDTVFLPYTFALEERTTGACSAARASGPVR